VCALQQVVQQSAVLGLKAAVAQQLPRFDSLLNAMRAVQASKRIWLGQTLSQQSIQACSRGCDSRRLTVMVLKQLRYTSHFTARRHAT
jgi:hypothetical protein